MDLGTREVQLPAPGVELAPGEVKAIAGFEKHFERHHEAMGIAAAIVVDLDDALERPEQTKA